AAIILFAVGEVRAPVPGLGEVRRKVAGLVEEASGQFGVAGGLRRGGALQEDVDGWRAAVGPALPDLLFDRRGGARVRRLLQLHEEGVEFRIGARGRALAQSAG